MFIAAAAVVLFTSVSAAADYAATTTANATIRVAPSQDAPAKGTIPAGTPVSVEVCFDEGVYCLVSAPDLSGAFVAGELLAVDGQRGVTVLAAEQEKWRRIRETKLNPKVPDWEARNIVVWGDSLSTNTFGDELEALLIGRRVSMQGVPGEDGSKIAARMLADTRLTGRLQVIWDRHYSNETVEQYMADLKVMTDRAAELGNFIVISDIAALNGVSDEAGNLTVGAEDDAARTEEINHVLRRQYPDNFLDVTDKLADPATRRDGLHLTDAGDRIVAELLADFVTAKGW